MSTTNRRRKADVKSAAEKPATPPIYPDNIPAGLKARPVWTCWRWERGESGEWTKPPYHPTRLQRADVTRAENLTSFTLAHTAYRQRKADGIGIALEVAGLLGYDRDDCRDPDTGEIDPDALGEVRELGTYTEVSPSGTGLKCLAVAKKPGKNCRLGDRELYDRVRYFTITGNILPGFPAEPQPCQAAVDRLYGRLWPGGDKAPPPPPRDLPPLDKSDEELLAVAFGAKNGAKIQALWNGDLSEYDGDHSRADCALLALLAFYFGTAGRLESVFGRSALGRRKKWTDRADYRARTMAKATAGITEFYSPPGPEVTFNGKAAPGGKAATDPAASDLPPISPFSPEWPKKLGEEAYHGLAGQFVAAVSPASESDPVALLAQFLVAVGNAVGRTAYATAEADRHYTNEFIVVVGKSAKGRKGTSWGRVQGTLARADEAWAQNRVTTGLSSGEGLVWAVRDPIEKQEKVSKRGETPQYESVTADPGESDKRLLVVEPEFANVLKQTERQGNTLSALVRQAWETGTLRSLTKNSPARATDAHISIIGHITADELRRYLTATESANGFGNRFLWLLSKRSKLLPDGGTPDAAALAAVERELAGVLAFARSAGEIRRDPDARDLWHQVYPVLSADRYGLAGSLTGRAEAHVLRLSVLYAVLDRSQTVRPKHLAASLALWEYADESVRCLFGEATGDPLADEILALLRNATKGITRSEVREMAGKNLAADRLARALGVLVSAGLARSETRETGGRPAELWFACGREVSGG
jgi:hypothetical protein